MPPLQVNSNPSEPGFQVLGGWWGPGLPNSNYGRENNHLSQLIKTKQNKNQTAQKEDRSEATIFILPTQNG